MVYKLVGWSVSWMVGLSDGWLFSQLDGWSVGWLVGMTVGWMGCQFRSGTINDEKGGSDFLDVFFTTSLLTTKFQNRGRLEAIHP